MIFRERKEFICHCLILLLSLHKIGCASALPWVTTAGQPDLKNLLHIAKAPNVDVARLLNKEVINEDNTRGESKN